MSRSRAGAVTTKKNPPLRKQIAFKAKTLGCGALKLTDITSLNKQMEKYVIAEKEWADARDKKVKQELKAKMEKAKNKWKLIRKCQIDRINKYQKNKIPYDDRVLDANFNQKRSAQARKILNKIGANSFSLEDDFKLQLKF